MATRMGSFLCGVGVNLTFTAAAIPAAIAFRTWCGATFQEACIQCFTAGFGVSMMPLNLQGRVRFGAFMSGKMVAWCLFGLLYWAVCADMVPPVFEYAPMVWSMFTLGASGFMIVIATVVIGTRTERSEEAPALRRATL